MHIFGGLESRVADLKLLISDPDSDPDPTCQVITDPYPTSQVVSDPDPFVCWSWYFRKIYVFKVKKYRYKTNLIISQN